MILRQSRRQLLSGSKREQAIGEIGNRFLEIEHELGTAGKFIGKMGLKGRRFQTF